MNPIVSKQLGRLQEKYPQATAQALPSGAVLIEIPDFAMPSGWNRATGTLLFVAPVGYPAAQPDCFWIEPVGLRLVNGATPLNTNDSTLIPEVGPRGTWFSWHLSSWNPNVDTLSTFLAVIGQRLKPAR